MNDAVVCMFRITRKEMLEMCRAKLASYAPALAQVDKAIEGAPLERMKEQLQKARRVYTDSRENVEYFRDHIGPDDHWSVSAQQLREIRTVLAPIECEGLSAILLLSKDPVIDVSNTLYNADRRPLRM